MEFSRTVSQLKYGEVPNYDQLKGLFSEWEEKLLNEGKAWEVRIIGIEKWRGNNRRQ